MEKRIILWFFLAVLSVNSQAMARAYKIELLIFAQDMPTTELFDQTESTIAWPDQVKDLSAYKQVSPRYMSLQGSHSKMASSINYRPIMHVGWIQSVGSNRLGTAVQISNPEGTINGYFRIRRGNLLHMIADIEYSHAGLKYRLQEKRRFKLNETHYLDHARFGIIARISPM